MNLLPHPNFHPAGRHAALVFLAALSFTALSARAAVTEAWVQRYSNALNNSHDLASKVVRDGAGDIFVIGDTSDGFAAAGMLIIKYSGADGSVLWQKRNPALYAAYPDSTPASAAVDGSGNLVVAGISKGAGTGDDFYTAKYAGTDGALRWEKRYNGPNNANDVPTSVAVDASGNVIVTGSSKTGVDYPAEDLIYPRDYYTAKYAAADGALIWGKRYDGPVNGDDQAQAVAVDASGNVAVTGFSDGGGSAYDCYTAMYAATDGALLWEKRYHGLVAGGWDFGNAVAVDAGGNVVVTGSSGLVPQFLAPDYYTAKYAAADGALLWEKRYDGPVSESDVGTAVAVDAGGDVVVTGFSSGSSGSYSAGHDFYTAKYAGTDGVLLWEKRYNGPAGNVDQPNALAVDAGGNVMVTGLSTGAVSFYAVKYTAAAGAVLWEQRPLNSSIKNAVMDGGGNVIVTGDSFSSSDIHTAKYAAADGAVVWEKDYDGPSNNYDEARALVVGADGNVAVTGASVSPGAESDYYTAMYAAADGALLWERRYDGLSHKNDFAQAMAMDAIGNVVVTGHSISDAYSQDYYTAKYAAADGALLWEKRGPAGSYYEAHAVAVDVVGNVVVTGTATLPFGGIGTNNDYYTAMYAAADGALLWEKYYNGPADSEDFAQAVAVDGGGNVLVTGTSYQGSDGAGFYYYADFYTAKYAAANGALLWERRYSGSANSDDLAAAMAVDAIGNVIVTGQSGSDYYTAKYAAADGALVWERRYHGPANSEDSATALAVDAGGNVFVTGSSATIKYLADGTTAWTRPGALQALAVDTSGDIVVAGNAGDDYYTAKYAAADGSVLWEKTYNGPANGPEIIGGAHCLALGPNGMVAITGASDGNTGSSGEVMLDYATVVYRETPPPVSFAAWAAGFGLSEGDAAAGADPDRDGLPNAAEYVLGGNPTLSAAPPSPTATVSGGSMVFTFPRTDASETPDVTLTVESGTDLVTWPAVFTIGPDTAASSPGINITENGPAPDTISVTVPGDPRNATFARLKITIAP